MTGPNGSPVRVVIAEDSSTARALLVAICSDDPGIQVVGEATNGQQAVELTRRLRPSLVLMDVFMPVMDGLEATKQIMRDEPTPIVMVTGSTHPDAVEAGLSAMRFGALTVLRKPQGTAPSDPTAQRLVDLVKALADVKVIRRRQGGASRRATPPVATGRVVAVGASTGGPPALCRFLQELPPDLPVPVVVVQHIVEGFLAGLVGWLRAEVPFQVTQAADGQRLAPGTVYLAPDGHHLEVERDLTASLTRSPAVSGFRPSATVLFRSVARSVGEGGIGVVLTGMGSDGLDGVRELRAAGGRILVQDENSSVVYGMPRVVADAGLSDLVAPVDQLAAEVSRLLRKGSSWLGY